MYDKFRRLSYIHRGMPLVPGTTAGVGSMMFGASFAEPEVNQNLATLNHFPCHDQAYIVDFLMALTEGYFQR